MDTAETGKGFSRRKAHERVLDLQLEDVEREEARHGEALAEEPHAALTASVHSVLGNTALQGSLAGELDGIGGILHEAMTLGAAGVHVASDIHGLLANSYVNDWMSAHGAGADPFAGVGVARRSQAEKEGIDTGSAKLDVIGQGGGAPLPQGVREKMEAAFGHDFSRVRIHTGAVVARSAETLNAQAFAIGDHIYFGEGRFAPGTPSGDHLLAHELQHVVQRDEGRLPSASGSGMDVSSPHDAHEVEAERVAADVSRSMAGGAVEVAAPELAAPDVAMSAPAEAPSVASADVVSRKEEEGQDGISFAHGVKPDAGFKSNPRGQNAKASLEGKLGVEGRKTIPLATIPITIGSEKLALSAKLELTAFAGVMGKVEASAQTNWKGGGKSKGIPKLDEFLEKVNQELVNKGHGVDGNDLSEQAVENARDDKKAHDTRAAFDAAAKKLDDEKRSLDWMRKQRDDAFNSPGYPTEKKKAWEQSVVEQEDRVKKAEQGLASTPSPSNHGARPTPDQRTSKFKTGGGQNTGVKEDDYFENDRSLREDKGVSAGVNAEAFVGVKAGAKLSAALEWERKDSKQYDLQTAIHKLVEMVKVGVPLLSPAIAAAESFGGEKGVAELMHGCAAFLFEFKAEKVELAGASVEFEARAGAGVSAKFNMGFTGGKFRWVAAAGATWGLGAKFDTEWSINLFDGGRLAMVMLNDKALQDLLGKVAKQSQEQIAAGVEKFFATWQAFNAWLASDDKAREIIAKGGHEALPAQARAELLKNMLVGFFNVISDEDEEASVRLLEFSRKKGDLGAVLDKAGRDDILKAIAGFEVPALQARALKALGMGQGSGGRAARKEEPGAAGGGDGAGFDQRLAKARGGGNALPDKVRANIEGAMGADFSGVRVHTGNEAAGLSRDLGARAFTVGQDVFFNQGQYQPETREGQNLLAHELTHVVQQGAAAVQKPQTKLQISTPGDTFEREADQVAGEVVGRMRQGVSVGDRQAGGSVRMGRNGPEGEVHGQAGEASGSVSVSGDGVSASASLGGVDVSLDSSGLSIGAGGFQTSTKAGPTKAGKIPGHAAAGGAAQAGGGGGAHHAQAGFRSGKPSDRPRLGGPGGALENLRRRAGQGLAMRAVMRKGNGAGAVVSGFLGDKPSLRAKGWASFGGKVSAGIEADVQDLNAEKPQVHVTVDLKGTSKDGGRGDDGKKKANGTVGAAKEAKDPGPPTKAPTPAPTNLTAKVQDAPRMTVSSEATAEEGQRAAQTALNTISTQSGVSSSAGPRPKVPLTGSTDPEKTAQAKQEGKQEADQAKQKAKQEVLQGRGPEAVKEQLMDVAKEAKDVFAAASTKEPAGVDGVTRFLDYGVPADVQAQFDTDQQAIMDASLETARGKMDEAVTKRDSEQEQLLTKASADEEKLRAEAEDAQRAELEKARGDITQAREDALREQDEAVAKIDAEATSRQQDEVRKIKARAAQDEAKIDTEYSKAEKQAETKIKDAEREAEDKKKEEEEKSKKKSWWDRVKSAVSDVFKAITDALNKIFDAVKKAVSAILDGVKKLATSIIDAATKFITDAIKAFGQWLKDLINETIGKVFPGIAKKLNGLIDAAVDYTCKKIEQIGQKLKNGVNALCDWIEESLNKLISAFQEAVNFCVTLVEAAMTGDWGKVARMLLEAVLKLAGIPPEEFFAIVGKAEESLDIIVADPGAFAGHVVDGLGQGFSQFGDNFPTHLKNGFMEWVTQGLATAGIASLKSLDLKDIFGFVLDTLGINKEYVRKKAVAHIGEKNVERIESVMEVVGAAMEGGWDGLWEFAQGYVDGWYDLVIGQITEFITTRVVEAAIIKIASMFNPVGAIVQAIITVWNVIQFVRTQIQRIWGVAKAIIESVNDLARGNIAKAANLVETALERLIPVAIDLLARLIGVTGIPEKVGGLIKKLQTKVDAVIDKVLDKIKATAGKVGGKLGLAPKKDEQKDQKNAEADKKALDGKDQGEDKGQEKKKDAPQSGETEALAERLPFQAGEEQHHLWVAMDGGAVAVMMASVPLKVSDKVDTLRPQLKELPKDQRQKIGSLIGKVIALERQLDKLGHDAQSTGKDAGKDAGKGKGKDNSATVKAKKKELADTMADLLLELPHEASLEAWNIEKSLKGPKFQQFLKQYNQLFADMGETPAAGSAENVWRQFARGMVNSHEDFETLKGADKRVDWKKDEEVLKKVLDDFNPLIQALSPVMKAMSAAKSKTWAFWSGNPGKDAAIQNGVNALEASALGAPFDNLNVNGQYDMQLWGAVSRAYAEHAKEVLDQAELIAFLGQVPSDKSIVMNIERPALRFGTEKVIVEPQIEHFGAASEPWDKKKEKADVAVTTGGRKATYDKSWDFAAGARAKAANEDRIAAYEELIKGGFTEEEAKAASRGKSAPDIRAALRAKGTGVHGDPQGLTDSHVKQPTTQPGLTTPVVGGVTNGDLKGGGGTGTGHGDGKNQDAKTVGLPVGQNGGPGTTVGKGNGSGEVKSGSGLVKTEHDKSSASGDADVKKATADKKANGGKVDPKEDPKDTKKDPKSKDEKVEAQDGKKDVKVDEGKDKDKGKVQGEVKALPSETYTDDKGEEHRLFIKNNGGSSTVMRASDNPQPVKNLEPAKAGTAFTLAVEIEGLTKDYLAEPDAGARDKKLGVIKAKMVELKALMAKARGEDKDMVQLRLKVEQELGRFAMKHPASNATATDMADKAWKLMETPIREAMAKAKGIDAALIQSEDLAKDPNFRKAVEKCGIDLNSGFFGAVGKTFEKVEAAMKRGNLREKCQHVINWGDVWAKQVFQTAPAELEALLQKAGVAKEQILAKKREVEAKAAKMTDERKKGDLLGKKGLYAPTEGSEFQKLKGGPDMDAKLPSVPLEACTDGQLKLLADRYKVAFEWDEATKTLKNRDAVLAGLKAKQKELGETVGATKKGEPNPLSQSERTRDQVQLSDAEAEGRGTSADVLPFLEGMIANLIDEEHHWVKEANDLEMPLRAGVSGNTSRFLMMARQLGADLNGARLAMLGHLIPTNAHSFHEIMVAAELPYNRGHYVPLEPLSQGDMEGVARNAGIPEDQIKPVLGLV